MQIAGNYQVLFNSNYGTNFKGLNCKNNIKTPIQDKTGYFTQNKSSDRYLADIYKSRVNQISFKALTNEMSLKNAVEKIFDRSIVFGPKEYKNLSTEDLNTIRQYAEVFLKNKFYSNCADFITSFGKYFSERIHQKYPDGFTFVSVGRSPAFLAKYLEFQGTDVKYCPISNIRSGFNGEFSSRFLEVYKKYLNSIGLTKDMVENSSKPIIITDYNYKGNSLKNFKRLMGIPEIGIYENEKVKFSPITACLKFNRENCIFNHDPYNNCAVHEKWDYSDEKFIENMEYEQTKWFTPVPYIDVRYFGNNEENILNIYYQNGNRFEENFDTKMMNFIIAETANKRL